MPEPLEYYSVAAVPCPICDQGVGERCRTPAGGVPMLLPHPERAERLAQLLDMPRERHADT